MAIPDPQELLASVRKNTSVLTEPDPNELLTSVRTGSNNNAPVGTEDFAKNEVEAWRGGDNRSVIGTGLTHGIGKAFETGEKAIMEVSRPSYKTPEQWESEQTGLTKKVLDVGRNLQKDTERQYEPYSLDWWLYNMADMAPTSVGLGLAGLAALRTSNPQVINQGATNLATRFGAGEKLANVATRLGAGGKIAQLVEKGAAPLIGETAGAGYIGSIAAYPEAVMEGQQAYESAYKEGQSEGMTPEQANEHATKVKNYVTAANMALLTGSNTAEIVAGLGKLPFKMPQSVVGKIVTNATRIGGAGVTEGAQEAVQQVIPKMAQDKPWSLSDEDVKQSAALGFGSGLMFGGVGAGARAIENMNQKNFDNQLQQFKNSITAVESGGDYNALGPIIDGDRARGKYQIMESNWPTWAEEAGLDRDAPWTPENQERVVDVQMRKYHQQFGGDWGKVAVAWQAGPDRASWSDERLATINDGNMTPVEYRNAVISQMGNIKGDAGNITTSPSSVSKTPIYTAEEKQQTVRWLEDQADKTDDVNELNKITELLRTKDIDNALNNYMVPSGSQEVPLGKFLFPDKFKQEGNVAVEQAPNLSDQNVDINKSRLAIDNARQALDTTSMEIPRPFIEPARVEQGQNLVQALNAIAANRFDQAEAAKAPLPSTTEPVKVQTPVSGPDVQQRLMELTGQQSEPAQIIQPNQQPNQAGMQAIEELRQRLLPQKFKLDTADEMVLKRALMQTLGRKDYTTAANIARQLGMDAKAILYENLVPRTSNRRERITTDDIKRHAEYEKLEDIEKLFIDTLEYYKTPLDAVENELESIYNKAIEDYTDILRGQIKQPGVNVPGENMSGDKFTRTHSQNYKWYMDVAAQYGYSANKLPKKILDEALPEIALDHLRNGYTDPLYGPQLSVDEVEKFNQLEAALDGVRQVGDRISPALSDQLRQPESGSTGNDRDIQQATRATIPIASELGKRQEIDNSADNSKDVVRQKQVEGALKSPSLRELVAKSQTDEKARKQFENLPEHIQEALKEREKGDAQNDERNEQDMERSSPDVPDGNTMGAESLRDGRSRAGRSDGQGSETLETEGDRPGSDKRLPDDSPTGSRSRSNKAVRDEETVDPERDSGSDVVGGGGSPSNTGVPTDQSAAKTVDESAADRGKLAAKLEQQRKANNVPVKVANLENIKETLPFLMEGQQQDVHFAETRLSQPDGLGVMFTNGTGTGKTYTGLGIVKRFERQGKKNILIVAPNDKIIEDWINSGKNLSIDITQLPDTGSAGKDITITTYANFGQNEALVGREWDLIIADESHYLGSSQSGELTNAAHMLWALTYHKRGFYTRFNVVERELIAKRDQADRDAELAEKSDDDRQRQDAPALREKANKLNKQIEERRNKLFAEWGAIEPKDKPRVTFLSATPFAYVETIDYADGYLFHYDGGQSTKDEYRGYNVPGNREAFYIQHFGYRMRYNKLTKPDANVDSEVMEQQFHDWLRQQGALSGRTLDVDKDYDRKFVLVSDAVGAKIDEGINWLLEANDGRYRPLFDLLNENFKYHQRMYLLESLKAKHAVPIIKDHLAHGRKVVVFHDFNKGGGFHPFYFTNVPNEMITNENGEVSLKQLVDEFNRLRPDLVKMDFSDLLSPIQQMEQSFPEALFFNGTVPKSERRSNVALFNNDDSGKNLLVVQADAGREGISLHDRTGKHQRVLINLGMPVKPTAAIQIEGRIYRTGQQSDAMFRYLNTGASFERYTFATKIAERASTAENLALGTEARALKQAFIEAYEMSGEFPAGMSDEGKGGREADRARRSEMSEFKRAISYYFGQQKKTSRNKAAEGTDYYATPEPIGLKMVEWADLKPGERALEPSAGHGAIARFFPRQGDHVMIEPSFDLGPRATMVSSAKLVTDRFENYHIVNKFDGIIMNPPFGHGGKTAVDHVAKAFKHLHDGGRIVAIIPDGGMTTTRFDKWMESDDAKEAYLSAEVKLPGVTFERAGTAVRTRIVVIEKHNDADKAPGYQKSIDLSGIDNIKELFERIENLSMPERKVTRTKEAKAVDNRQGTEKASYELAEFAHTKTKKPVYVAKPQSHLGDSFKDVSAIAKKHGGWYNSYSKGGAVAGFAFEDKENRNKFLKDVQANNAFKEDIVKEDNAAYNIGKELQRLHPEYASNKEALSLAEKAIQLTLDFDRETEFKSAREEGNYLQNSRGLQADDRRGSGSALRSNPAKGKFIGYGVTKELINNGVVSLVGETAQSPEQLGEIAQVLRHPGYETFHIVYMKSNTVVHHEAVSSRLPGVSAVLLPGESTSDFYNRLHNRIDWVSADGYYFVHNHPSGRPIPSNEDLNLTKSIANITTVGGSTNNPINRGFKGHVVINSNVFTVIDRHGDYKTHFLDVDSQDQLLSPSISHPALGNVIKGPESLASVAKSVQLSPEHSVVFYLTNQNKIRGVQVMPNEILLAGTDKATRYLRWSARASFAAQAVVVTDSDSVFEATKPLVEKGHVLDSFHSSKRLSARDDKVQVSDDGTWMGQEIKEYGNKVLEENAEYGTDSESAQTSVQQATAKLAENLGLKPAEKVTYIEKPTNDDPKFIGRWLNSVKVLADKHPKLKPFFNLAETAMKTQEDLRQHFQHRLQKVEKVLGNTGFVSQTSKEYKENKASLYKILLDGDANEKNFTTQELHDLGYNDQVVKAYQMIRTAYQHAWKLANEIRQGIETKSENMTAANLAKLKQNKFVEIISEKQKGEDNYLVTWKQPKLSEYAVTITKQELDELKDDPNVQVISEKPLSVVGHALPQEKGIVHGDEFFEVEYRSQKPPITNRAGYVPHFFHEWFVMSKDEEGNTEMLFSARTAREALAKANEYAKQAVDGVEIVVKPKQFKFPGADVTAAVMGDMNYFKMVNKVSDDLEISLDDAREFLDGKVHMKNRHRFVGNFLKRKGANGWEQDLDWVNRHYFNMVSRYVAMDPFKSKSISMFERLFGQYALEYDGLGEYVKQYINDINGVPSDVERELNAALNSNKWINKFLGDYLGERPAAQLASALTDAVAVAKLGMYNISSAIIQTTQFINVASTMDSYEYALKGLGMAIKPNNQQRLILHRAGVDANLSMESGAGYSKAGQMKQWFQGTTAMFRYLDILMRRAAVLGAYNKAIEKGKSRGAALEYAKEVNRKANFEYGVQDAPNAFRRSGPVGQIVLQFKKYPIKQFELMADLAQHGNIRQNTKFWVPMLLLAGMWSIPAIGLLKIFANMFGWDWEKETKAALMNWAGDNKTRQALAKTAMYGIMSNAGVDVSKRTGMGDVIPTETRDMFGPVLSTLYQTGREMSRSNWYEAVKAVSPGVGNALVAIAGETHGVRGRVKTKYETFYERIIKGMGFMPTEESVDRDKEYVSKYLERERRDDEEKAIDNYIQAYKSDDVAEKQKAIKKLQELRISPKRVRDEMMRKDKTNVQRQAENIPKKQQQQYRQIMSFE